MRKTNFLTTILLFTVLLITSCSVKETMIIKKKRTSGELYYFSGIVKKYTSGAKEIKVSRSAYNKHEVGEEFKFNGKKLFKK